MKIFIIFCLLFIHVRIAFFRRNGVCTVHILSRLYYWYGAFRIVHACVHCSKGPLHGLHGSDSGLIGGEACSFTGATLLRETSHRPSMLLVVVVGLMPVRIALRTHAASRSLGLHGSTWSTWLVPLVKGVVLSDLAICTNKPYFYIILFWSMQLTKQSHLADSNLIESQRTRYWLHLPPKQLLIRSTSTPFTTQQLCFLAPCTRVLIELQAFRWRRYWPPWWSGRWCPW